MLTSRRTFLTLTAVLAGVLALPGEVLARPALTPERMAKLFGEVECRDEKVERIWVHPRMAARFPVIFGVDAYDQQSHGMLLKMGVAGSLWGADVRTNEAIPEGDIELVGTVDWDGPRNTRLSETACSALYPSDWGAKMLGAS